MYIYHTMTCNASISWIRICFQRLFNWQYDLSAYRNLAHIEDEKTLFACLTVSRSLLRCVEKYLYASADLPTGAPSRLLSFQNAIESHPKRVDRVRSLTIRLDPDLLRSTVIDDILCKVNNVEYLHIRLRSQVLLPPFPRFFGSDRKTLPSLTRFRWEGYHPTDGGLSRFLELYREHCFKTLLTRPQEKEVGIISVVARLKVEDCHLPAMSFHTRTKLRRGLDLQNQNIVWFGRRNLISMDGRTTADEPTMMHRSA